LEKLTFVSRGGLTQSTSLGVTESPLGELLYKGAEADIVKGEWRGLIAVYKVRKPLPYRLSSLDTSIRRQRTIREAELLQSARRAGVIVPRLYFVDTVHTTLVMECVGGMRLRELVSQSEREMVGHYFNDLGKAIARLHCAGIVHGDLTTANVIIRDGELVLVDFGLSNHSTKLEDQAVDLRLVKETLVGAHHMIASVALQQLFAGYSSVLGPRRFHEVSKQLSNIERRGRYARIS